MQKYRPLLSEERISHLVKVINVSLVRLKTAIQVDTIDSGSATTFLQYVQNWIVHFFKSIASIFLQEGKNAVQYRFLENTDFSDTCHVANVISSTGIKIVLQNGGILTPAVASLKGNFGAFLKTPQEGLLPSALKF